MLDYFFCFFYKSRTLAIGQNVLRVKMSTVTLNESKLVKLVLDKGSNAIFKIQLYWLKAVQNHWEWPVYKQSTITNS